MKKRLLLVATLIAVIVLVVLPTMTMAQSSETLRPEGAGYLTQLTPVGDTPNWECVDEAVADTVTYVRCASGGGITYHSDYYTLEDTAVGAGLISSVTIYSRCQSVSGGAGGAYVYPIMVRTHDTLYDPLGGYYEESWTTYSHEYTTNPYTSYAWTWDEIDALQVGVKMRLNISSGYAKDTQMYVVVAYSPPVAPTVTTQAATVTSNTTATGNGQITNTGGANCDTRGVVYDTATRGDPGDTAPGASAYSDNITEHGDFGTGAFTASLTGLAQGTPYYYRAFAHNSEGYSYGNEVSFVTADVPVIVTNAATNVAYTTARLNSNLTDDGRETCEVRFQYSLTTDNWSMADNTTWVGGYTVGQQPYVDLTSLTPNETYYFRAQAKNAYGTVSGTGLDFTTPSDILEPTNLAALSEGGRVVLSWTIGGGSTETAIRYKEGSYPTTVSDGILGYFGTLSNAVLEDLEPGTTIYISAWGHSGDTYSDNYTTVMATPYASTGEEAVDVPGFPASWFQIPSPTVLEAFPFYTIANAFFVSYGVPIASGWFFTTLFGCIVFAIFVFAVSRHPMPAMIALSLSLALTSLMKLLPMFMMAFAVVFMLGAFKFGRSS